MTGRSPTGEMIRLISLEEESRLLLRLRATLVWQMVRSMVTGSRLRLSLVVVLSGQFWAARDMVSVYVGVHDMSNFHVVLGRQVFVECREACRVNNDRVAALCAKHVGNTSFRRAKNLQTQYRIRHIR